MSGRLVAAMTTTPRVGEKPSICTSNSLSVCSRASLPPPSPAPGPGREDEDHEQTGQQQQREDELGEEREDLLPPLLGDIDGGAALHQCGNERRLLAPVRWVRRPDDLGRSRLAFGAEDDPVVL